PISNQLLGRLLRGRRPANAGRNGRVIVLALDGIYPAALVEAKNLVAEIQAVSHHAQALSDPIAALHIKLCVSIEIDVASRALQTKNRIVEAYARRSRIVVRVDVGVIVADAKAHRKAGLVVSKAKIPCVRRLAQ